LAHRCQASLKSKEGYKELLESHVEELSSLQRLHYASNRYALLLIFQGMDAAGKEGAIRHVMSGVNPQGCHVSSFKQPSADELEHDFLWRTTRQLPARGKIGISNRSYYEEVLVVKVHPEILQAQQLPEKLRHEKNIWDERYQSITNFERHLHRNGTRTIKMFLHLSNEEQRKRFLGRIDEADKNWKFSASDVHERKYWTQYTKAFEDGLSSTTTRHAPWYVVPADDKENARLIVSKIVLDALAGLKMAYPKSTEKRRVELQTIRKIPTMKSDETRTSLISLFDIVLTFVPLHSTQRTNESWLTLRQKHAHIRPAAAPYRLTKTTVASAAKTLRESRRFRVTAAIRVARLQNRT